jgi:sugar phosphate isomerase/epimerase
MVWSDAVSQDARALVGLSKHYNVPVRSVHAPCLMVTQRVWSPDPWERLRRAAELADTLGADVVVVHPPFRWQKEYARDFAEGIALREHDSGIRLAVENMFPWRARQREYQAYLPHWDPVPLPYDNVTLDLSHTATAGSDAMQMARALGPRLAHVHLADGLGSLRDEHLVPGRGAQPCAEFLEMLAGQGFSGSVVVEVGTRRLTEEQRDLDLAEALAFARLHLAAAAQPRGKGR